MVPNIAIIIPPQAPAPQPQAAPPAGTAGAGDQAPSGSSSNPPATGNTQNTQPQNTQNGNNTGNSGNAGGTTAGDHFSKLLAKQGDSSQPGNTVTGPTGNAPIIRDGSNQTAGTNLSASAIAVLVLSQLQTDSNTNTADGQGTSSAITPALTLPVQTGAASTSSNDGSALQQLLALLQQIAPTLVPQSTPTTTQPATDTQQPVQDANSLSTGSAITQALSGLEALLQNATTPAASSGTPAPTAIIPSATDAGSASALLAKLAQLLEQQNTTGNIQGNNAPAATNTTPVDTKFSSLLNILSQGPSAITLPQTSDLASVLSQIAQTLPSGLVTTADTGSNGNSATGNNNNGQNTSSSAQTASPPPVGTPSTAPQAPSNEFVKLLSSASAGAPTPGDQVIVQIRSAINTGASQITVQLEPADLGKVQVQMMTGTDGKTGVTITADNRQTLSMLQSEARSLESALRNIGLKTDTGGLSFNLRGEQQNQQTFGNKPNLYAQVAAIGSGEDDSLGISPMTGIYQLSAQQGLDIRV